jgi:hypothetical protein
LSIDASLRLPEEARRDLEAKIAIYERLKAESAAPHPGADKEVDQIRAKLDRPESLWWTDLLQVELCLIEVLGDEDIKERVLRTRQRMREVIGETRFAAYMATAPDAATSTPQALQADLSGCIRAIYYFYATYGLSARSRSWVTTVLLRAALLVITIELIVAAIIAAPIALWPWTVVGPNVKSALEWLIATSIAAVCGGVVSVQRRVEDPSVDVDPFYRFITTRADWVGTAVVSTLFSAMFGPVVFGLFASSLIQGLAFPNFQKGTFIPETPKDMAELLIFGFIAGFAEQFVPDALTRIARRALGASPESAHVALTSANNPSPAGAEEPKPSASPS